MLKLSNLKVPASLGKEGILPAAAKKLGIAMSDISRLEILRLSVDSRKKSNVLFSVTAAVECANEGSVLRKNDDGDVCLYFPKIYKFPYSGILSDIRPVIVGMGPAGLFAALTLAEAGLPCTIIERGRKVEDRIDDIEAFWQTGKLDEESNVQFGEGGAGTFSDGKLTTGVNNERIGYVFRQFVRFGAPEDILYLAKPHIGTDNLRSVIKNIRSYLIEKGCTIHFSAKLTGLETENGRLKSVEVTSDGKTSVIPVSHMILAVGNSARDTFRMLNEAHLPMQAKNFAVGVRIEHWQKDIDLAQYGEAATLGTLPASDYKLAVHLPDGRSVFTFCVCPGGQVVAATSQTGHTVTNGMSEYSRDEKNINGGLLVNIDVNDFNGELFGGMELQDFLEVSAYSHGGKHYEAPAQLVGDFLNRVPSKRHGKVTPSYRPGVNYCNLWDVLPEFICSAIAKALPEMEKKIRGFASPDAVLTAVETRSSSPVRILRGDDLMSEVYGIFPCGEGAGFAGGISSAASDGIRCAEALCKTITG